jgi:hypothetical protein
MQNKAWNSEERLEAIKTLSPLLNNDAVPLPVRLQVGQTIHFLAHKPAQWLNINHATIDADLQTAQDFAAGTLR